MTDNVVSTRPQPVQHQGVQGAPGPGCHRAPWARTRAPRPPARENWSQIPRRGLERAGRPEANLRTLHKWSSVFALKSEPMPARSREIRRPARFLLGSDDESDEGYQH
jgi:hypothetical protein